MYSSNVGNLHLLAFTLFMASMFIRSLETSVGALDSSVSPLGCFLHACQVTREVSPFPLFSFDRKLGNVSGSFLRTPYALLLMIHPSDRQR